MPILRGTTPIWGTQDLPGGFKEWKACLVEIGQTAHKLETNARANFPMAENLSTLKLRGGPEHAREVCFTLIVPFIKHL